jgi:hypothetical protein
MANTADIEYQDRRDDKLRRLLPLIDSSYDFCSLSQAETDALEEAFSDGFGAPVRGREALPLPRDIKSGLLNHPFYFRSDPSEDNDEDPEDAFYEDGFDGAPGPSEQFPLGFIPRRLRIYFKNQLDRFCHKMIREQPGLASWERWGVEDLALDRLYEKPWYEFYAIEWLDFIDQRLQTGVREVKGAAGLALLVSCFAGELGRLSEQYYWRFRYEGATITGIGARKGASIGGKSKAALHQTQHWTWQKAALEIWKRKPELSKMAVAEIIRRRYHVPRTAKHIARYIRRSQQSQTDIAGLISMT